jgi:hypothetical protein
MGPIPAARNSPQRSLRWLIVAVAVLASGCALFATQPNVMLSGRESVPAVSTTGFGMGRIQVSKDRRVSGTIKVSGVDVTSAHIHVGRVGRIGPPIITLEPVSNKVWAVPLNAVLSDGQYDSYKAGGLYINVYSRTHKAGEIRGQLKPSS